MTSIFTIKIMQEAFYQASQVEDFDISKDVAASWNPAIQLMKAAIRQAEKEQDDDKG